MAPETITDLIVVAIIVLSGLLALFRGLVKEALSIISWVGAVFVTLLGFMPLRPITRNLISVPLLADAATGAILFFGTLLVLGITAHLISKFVQGSAVGVLDRTLGFVFGLARGLLIVVVLFMGLSWMLGPDNQPRWFRNARTVPFAETGARVVLSLVPENVRRLFPRIVAPQPATPTEPTKSAPSGREGYRTGERRDMQRLIEGTQ